MLHSADLDLVHRDTALPGFGTLLDPEAFAHALRRHLPEAGRLDVRYIRYKPAENAVVAADVWIGGTLCTVHAKAHRADAHAKLAKAAARTVVDGLAGRGQLIWEDQAIVVSLFPNDAKLKALRRLATPDTRRQLVQRILFDRPDLMDIEPITLRYKPERRWVGRIGDVVIKLHSASGFPDALGARSAGLPKEGMQTPRVVGRSVRHRAIATSWVDGRVLDAAIRDPDVTPAVVAPVGAALAALHRQPVGEALPVRNAVPALRAAVEAVAATCPELANRVRDLTQRIETALATHPSSPVLVHGDFYAKQVILSPGVPTVLDFDRLGVGEAAADLATFIAHLERDRLRFGLDLARAEAVQDALLDGYAHHAELPSDAALAAHTATALVGLAPHPFRFREPDWPARTAALLDVAERHLEEALPRPTQPPSRVTDPAMPALDVALDPKRASDALAGLLGAERVGIHDIHLRRHRPGRRALVEYALDANGPKRVFAKVCAKGLDRTTLQLNRALWVGGFGAGSDVAVPEPLGAWPEARAWVQAHVEAEPTAENLAGPHGPDAARRIAHALRRLHQHGPPPTRRHTLADELAHLHARVPTAATVHPTLAPRLRRVLEACDALAIPTVAPRPIHRDAYPDNVLVTPAQVILLDLDLYALGDPALDAGNMVAHLIELGLRDHGDPEALATPIEAFVDTFAESDRQLDAVEAWTTLALVRHLAISTRVPERRPLTPALLDLCEARLLGVTVPSLT
ncbi:MAG: hypothetical protein Rubg2KO_29340 [Rubricoccaceae bacterium]